MRVHVLTAVSRPENLPKLKASLQVAAASHDVDWHTLEDPDRRYVGGQVLKNRLLDRVREGWVWILDDDTVVHPDLFDTVSEYAAGHDAVVVSQQRADGSVLEAHPDHVAVGRIDIGQAVIRRRLIGGHRIPDQHDGDGYFLQTVLQQEGARVKYLPRILSYHNRLASR